MRKLLWLFLIFLFGCSAGTEQPSTASGSDRQAELRERLDRVVDQQLAREHFSFSIILEDHSKYRFVGEQRGADWTLKSEGAGEPIQVQKKGDEIELTQRKNKETLSEQQFGLISPRDHLILLQEAAGRVNPLSAGDPEVEGMEVVLDRERIGQIVEEQMGFQKAARDIAEQASRKIRVRYLLWYRAEDRELTRMEIHLDSIQDPSPAPEKHIRYIFRNQ
ncbi:MAG: hypothetical protein ACOYEF_08830 [Planifilum sp.]|mgnify:CR=1 FL=1|jgi:hypothetical protein